MHPQTASIDKRRIADSIVVLALATLVCLYCLDAVRASADILNLILVLPVSIVVLALCLAQLARDIARFRAGETSKESIDEEPSTLDVLPLAGVFAAYVLTLPWLGFDVGTSLFIAAFLWLQGERRYVWLLGYSIGFAFALAELFARMLPYPMPMLVLGTT